MHVQIEDRKNSLLLITFGIGVKQSFIIFLKNISVTVVLC